MTDPNDIKSYEEQISKTWKFEWGVEETPRVLPKPILEEPPKQLPPTDELIEFKTIRGDADDPTPPEQVTREHLLRRFRKVRGL